MPTSILAVVALSILLGFLVIILHWVDSHGPDSTAADHTRTDTETAAGTNINRGSGV
ncbi:hypothetical protein [Streptomyces sp. JV178]|uniref:hypothetical protein n=1 Tax=Streptomyces sp. JV178 TaxID=858632 RepID=UPI00211F144E|nr:hypothetical protein [Streptomyces sp. JV178]